MVLAAAWHASSSASACTYFHAWVYYTPAVFWLWFCQQVCTLSPSSPTAASVWLSWIQVHVSMKPYTSIVITNILLIVCHAWIMWLPCPRYLGSWLVSRNLHGMATPLYTQCHAFPGWQWHSWVQAKAIQCTFPIAVSLSIFSILICSWMRFRFSSCISLTFWTSRCPFFWSSKTPLAPCNWSKISWRSYNIRHSLQTMLNLSKITVKACPFTWLRLFLHQH